MHLSWLELTNTRCYETLRFEPAEGINVLIGSNGAGKTSILEAAAYLGLLKSFRGTPDDALVRNGSDRAVIRGEFVVESGTTRVEVELPRPGRRRVLVNEMCWPKSRLLRFNRTTSTSSNAARASVGNTSTISLRNSGPRQAPTSRTTSGRSGNGTRC